MWYLFLSFCAPFFYQLDLDLAVPLHLVLDDVHDRKCSAANDRDSVLVILQGYQEHYPELIARVGDLGEYELELCGFKDVFTSRQAHTRSLRSVPLAALKKTAPELKSLPILTHLGCPLQLELCRVGSKRLDLGLVLGAGSCQQHPRSSLIAGPRWDVVSQLLHMDTDAVFSIRKIYEQKACNVSDASSYLSSNTGCLELLPLHRCLALNAPAHVVMAVLTADLDAVHSMSAAHAGLTQENVLHLAVAFHHSPAVVQALLNASSKNAQLRNKRSYATPVHSAMQRLARQYHLLTGGKVSEVELYHGDSILWKSGKWSGTRWKKNNHLVLVAQLVNPTNNSMHRSLYLPPHQTYPGRTLRRTTRDALVEQALPLFLIRHVFTFLDETLYTLNFDGVVNELPDMHLPGNLEYVEIFENQQAEQVRSQRKLRLKRITSLMQTIDVLIPAHPIAMYDVDPRSGRTWIEVFRKTMVSVRSIQTMQDSVEPAMIAPGGESKVALQDGCAAAAAAKAFQPLGRRPMSLDIAATHLVIEATCLSAIEKEMHLKSTCTARRFMLDFLGSIVQTSLHNELLGASQHTALLRDVYIANRAGHRGMYGASLNGIRVQPQFIEFVQRADQLGVSIQRRSRRRGSGVGIAQQDGVDLHALYVSAHRVKERYEDFLCKLSKRTGGTYMKASMKKPLRVLEKSMVATAAGDALKARSGISGISPTTPWKTSGVLDIVRGALSFNSMNEMLMCLELLAATTTDENSLKECQTRGWDAVAAGIGEKTHIVRIKNRFNQPTSGGWADAMVNFRFADEEHVCEIQFVHSQMMLVRKQMGAHYQYEQFRSARELLEATGNADVPDQIDSEANAKAVALDQSNNNVTLDDRVLQLEEQVQLLMKENEKLWQFVKTM